MEQQRLRAARIAQWVAAAAFSTIIAVSGWPTYAADLGKKTSDAAREQADKIRAITGGSTGATPVPAGDPCRLVNNNEVHKAFPKSVGVNGQTDHSRDEYGIVACIWDYPSGRVVVRVTLDATPGGSKNDVQMFTDANPLHPASGIRYEKIAGVGDEAVAVVEARNASQNIKDDLSVIVTQRGKQEVVIVSSDLPATDRAASLKVMEDLGRTAMSRL